MSFNARIEFKMDAMRQRIVREDLSFNTLPRAQEYLRYQPFNNFSGRALDGRVISYISWGAAADITAAKEAFSVQEYVDLLLSNLELKHVCMDALCAVEGRIVAQLNFCDFSGASIGNLMSMVERELEGCGVASWTPASLTPSLLLATVYRRTSCGQRYGKGRHTSAWV